MPRHLVRALAALTIISAIAFNATAAGTAEDAIKFRHAIMTEMAAHMAALNYILTVKVDAEAFAQGHADALARASAEMDVLFPAGSGEGDTEALPAIWEDAEAFAAAVDEAQQAATKLQATLAGGDRKATMAAFAATGKTCKNCHESYRAEHDHDVSH